MFNQIDDRKVFTSFRRFLLSRCDTSLLLISIPSILPASENEMFAVGGISNGGEFFDVITAVITGPRFSAKQILQ